MKKFLVGAAIVLGVALVLYNIWAYSYRATEKKSGWVAYPRPGRARFGEYSIGKNNGKGNIIAIQPYFTPQNYSTGFNFLVTLRLYLEQAKKDSLIGEKTAILFPEHIGTPLFAVNEKEIVYSKSSMKAAMKTMVYSNFFTWLPLYFSDTTEDKLGNTILNMKSVRMANVYNETFSGLAKEYGVTIIAGSIVLSEPYINDSGELKTGKGPLYDISVIYGPDGKVVKPLIRDRFEEFIRTIGPADSISNIPVFKISTGALSMVRSAHLKGAVSNKSFSPETNILISRLFEDAHSGGATSQRFEILKTGSTIRNAIHMEFTGDMWNQSSDGNFFALNGDSIVSLGTASKRGRIINVWIE